MAFRDASGIGTDPPPAKRQAQNLTTIGTFFFAEPRFFSSKKRGSASPPPRAGAGTASPTREGKKSQDTLKGTLDGFGPENAPSGHVLFGGGKPLTASLVPGDDGVQLTVSTLVAQRGRVDGRLFGGGGERPWASQGMLGGTRGGPGHGIGYGLAGRLGSGEGGDDAEDIRVTLDSGAAHIDVAAMEILREMGFCDTEQCG